MSYLRVSSNGSNVVKYERLRLGRYYADFLRDKRLSPEVYHCIVQRQGSTEILCWSQHRSLEDAMGAARDNLKQLADEENARQSKIQAEPA
jgi:hypothetical protein